MAESTIRKTKNLTRDTLPRDSNAIREDTKQTVSAAHQDKPGYMVHGIAKMETDTCRLDVQENIQTGAQKDVIDIKEEVRDLDSEFPEQFEDISREKCYSSHEIAIADVRGDTDIKVDFHGQIELFNRDKCVSDQEMFMTYTQGDIIENSSALTGKENHQNIKNRSFEHKMYGINVKGEIMENDAELQKCFDVNNTEESISPLESILKNVKNSIGLVKITNIKTCDSAHTFNNTLVKKEEPEDDVEFSKHFFQSLYCEQSGSVDKIIIANVKCGFAENETNLHRELRGQTVEKTVSEKKSNVKDEKIEVDRNLPDNFVYVLNQVSAKDITEEKTQKLHKCNVCNKRFRSKEKFTGHMKTKIHQKRDLKCEICNKVFYRNRKLNLHMNVHTKEQEFKCDVCDEIYFLKSLLITHMQSHLNEELRSCKFCGKIFSTTQSLKRHLNLHTKEKEFKCKMCGKAFYRKDSFNKHKINHTIKAFNRREGLKNKLSIN